MQWWLIGVAAVVVIGLALAPRLRDRAAGAKQASAVARLQKRYLLLLNQPLGVAQQTLERELAEMRRRHPRRSARWQMQKLIADLERDRR